MPYFLIWEGVVYPMDWGKSTTDNLIAIRETRPLIHNITNLVVMNWTANVILAVGASPVMAHALEEVREMASMAKAVVLNMGTLEADWVEAMITAGKTANELDIPVVFDPVGVGATSYRNQSAARIMAEVDLAVIRGNAAEILSLAGKSAEIKGVDSLVSSDFDSTQFNEIAERFHTVLAVTGERDYVCNGNTCCEIRGGHRMFQTVTGTGCAASAVCACFTAVEKDYFHAAIQALAFYGIAGKEAAKHASGPGTFQMHLLDRLAGITEADLKSLTGVRIL